MTKHCPKQHRALNMIFITVNMATRIAAVLSGWLTDAFGPRITRLTAVMIFTLAGISWFFLNIDRPWIIYLASIFMSTGVYMSYFALQQCNAFVFDKYQATALGLQSGALDSSAAIQTGL